MPHTLYVSLTSPYARLTRAVRLEKALQNMVDEAVVDPFADPATLIAANPAGQVPALQREDGGVAIIDCRLIAAWLDHLPSDQPSLVPAGGPTRMAVRNAEALAVVLMDKSVARVLEGRRPPEAQHAPTKARLTSQIDRIVAAFPGHQAALRQADAPHLNTGTLAMACALAHLDFRHPDIGWRRNDPTLAGWLDGFSKQACLAETAPPRA